MVTDEGFTLTGAVSEDDVIDGDMAAILQSGRVGQRFKHERVTVRRTVGDVRRPPATPRRVRRQPHVVD